MFDVRVGIVFGIALRIAAETEDVEVRRGVEEGFQVAGKDGAFLLPLPGRKAAEIQIFGGFAEIVLMAGDEKAGDGGSGVGPVQWVGRGRGGRDGRAKQNGG